MNTSRWRPAIESAHRLSLARLFETGALEVAADTSGCWHWSRNGKKVAEVRYEASLGETEGTLGLFYNWTHDGEVKAVRCHIRLSTLPLNYGGRRWYMHCPYTDRRALVLHKFPAIEQFCHRTAVRPLPTYASQRVGGCDRVMAQRWALRRRMGDTMSDLCGEPYKPKWMRWHTFERYAARDAELAERECAYMQRMFGIASIYNVVSLWI